MKVRNPEMRASAGCLESIRIVVLQSPATGESRTRKPWITKERNVAAFYDYGRMVQVLDFHGIKSAN